MAKYYYTYVHSCVQLIVYELKTMALTVYTKSCESANINVDVKVVRE